MRLDRKIEAENNSSKAEADQHVHHLIPGIKSFSKYVGLAVSLIGLLVLSGWLLDIEQLNNAFAGLSAMEANTAIAFITAGLSLWLRGSTSIKMQTAARVLGLITGLVGFLTLGEYVSGRNFGIDELIFKDLAASGVLYPGRMSFMSALNFTMMGMALFLLDSDNWRTYNLGPSLTLVASLIAYIALAGYLFDVDSLYRVGIFAPMAFHTSFSFILLFVGMVCAQPEDGWVGNLIADTPGGDLLRRLLPVAFVVPILLGWLRLQGQLAGYYETAFGTTLLAVAITLFLSVIIWFNAKGLTRVDMDRRRAEQNLRASEALYHNLFDLVPVAVYTCDAEGLIQKFNHRAVELWGREPLKNDPREKFCGSFKIYYPDGRFMPHEKCQMARMLRGETLEPHELEILVERPDGLRRNVLAHPLPLKDESGQIVGAINCLYDISERKQAEEALHQLNFQLESQVQSRTAKLRSVNQSLREEINERKRVEEQLIYQALLISNVNDAIIATDDNLVVTYWNPTAEQIYGWSAEEVMGRMVSDILQTEFMDGNTRSGSLQKVNELHELRTAVTHLRKNGSRIFVEAHTSTLLNEDGRINGYVSINRDITERKKAEQELRLNRDRLRSLSQRLVEVQEEERRTIANELHDRVGQSLSALNINLTIMRDQLSADAVQRIGPRMNDSMQLAAEAITLVRDVMSDLRPAVLDDYGLEAALQSYMDQFKSRYGIKILFEKPDQPILRMGPSIEMTFLRIAQEALLNIARHARADQVNLSLWQEQQAIRLVIQDNGTGIQSWQEANRPGSHGLTIMRERADAVGGNLRVLSVPGKGTKVEVRIPLENGSPQTVQKERQHDHSHPG